MKQNKTSRGFKMGLQNGASKWGFTLLIASSSFLVGCDKQKIAADDLPVQSDAILQLSYDEEIATFATPELLGKSTSGKVNSNAPLMIDFQGTSQKMTFDKDGFMHQYTIYDENDPDQQMPKEAFDALKDKLPYRGSEHTPPVKSILEGNARKYLDRNGNVVYTEAVNPDDFKIDVTQLQAYLQNNPQKTDRVALFEQSLKDQNIVYQKLKDDHFLIEQHSAKDGNTSKQVVNGKIGQPVWVQIEKNGKVLSETTLSYKILSNFPVLETSTVYTFGEVQKKWNVVYETQTSRSNLKLITN